MSIVFILTLNRWVGCATKGSGPSFRSPRISSGRTDRPKIGPDPERAASACSSASVKGVLDVSFLPSTGQDLATTLSPCRASDLATRCGCSRVCRKAKCRKRFEFFHPRCEFRPSAKKTRGAKRALAARRAETRLLDQGDRSKFSVSLFGRWRIVEPRIGPDPDRHPALHHEHGDASLDTAARSTSTEPPPTRG